MALFGRAAQPGRRHSTALDLANPGQHADWTVHLGQTWRLLHHRATLAVVDPDRSYGVHSADGLLLAQIDNATIDDQDRAAAAFAGLPTTIGENLHLRAHPSKREKLRIRDTHSRIIAAECHQATGGILIRLLPDGPVNPTLIARTLPTPIADALIRSGPWIYRVAAPGQGELRRLDNRIVARDTFTRTTPIDPTNRRGGLTWWSIRVEANPLPSSWLFALFLACERLRR